MTGCGSLISTSGLSCSVRIVSVTPPFLPAHLSFSRALCEKYSLKQPSLSSWTFSASILSFIWDFFPLPNLCQQRRLGCDQKSGSWVNTSGSLMLFPWWPCSNNTAFGLIYAHKLLSVPWVFDYCVSWEGRTNSLSFSLLSYEGGIHLVLSITWEAWWSSTGPWLEQEIWCMSDPKCSSVLPADLRFPLCKLGPATPTTLYCLEV